MDNMTPDEWKEARAYAWGYFALHADQRMRLFNFFLILSAFLLGAFSAVKKLAPGPMAESALPLLLVLVAFVFWRLEERTRALVKNGEDALRFLDEEWPRKLLSDQTPGYLRLFERDDHLMELAKERRWVKYFPPISYAESFRITYLTTGVVGLGLIAWVWS